MWHNHVCGCYFELHHQRKYLPQVQLTSHTTISPVSFSTELTQLFHNPSADSISQFRYTFPLYDGVTVCGYTISYADKTLQGVVKQKEVAKQTYQAAVDRGETAGLLESLPAGVFGVTLGNVPTNTDIVVNIRYCGELKHDAAIDGLRFILPTSIAPRYGSYPGQVLSSNVNATQSGMKITVDADMGKSAIRRVQSPTHPIAVSMGEVSTAIKDGGGMAPFTPSQASATLSQGSAELAGDFVLQLLIDDINKPQAILEAHPTLPNQRAIMTTLVPKFVLEPAHPEIIFIADQSGSMSGSKNASLVQALKVFLKSLPLGVRFNLMPFGSSFQMLWPKSQAYSEENLNTALQFVDTFRASYGGTELLEPIKAAFKNHLDDMPLEVMLLTDGEIWQENTVFDFINKEIRDKGVDARVFALGIGQDVSHTLVEGIARAGNGFAQFVTNNEDTDQKVIRMLKGALYAHTKDYELEVHYGEKETASDDDDFEIVEKVNDCLTIAENRGGVSEKTPEPAKPKSFFDNSAHLDEPVGNDSADRYAHLPAIDMLKVLQAPATLPPLFPFNRNTAYLLLGPQSAQKEVTSVTLRARSSSGPLELNIPISGNVQGNSVHQLAARKAIQDLEEGRGWLHSARINDGTYTLVKTKYKNRLDEIVEREAVRLGEKFQVASKWTSFVAVEANAEAMAEPPEQVTAPPGGLMFDRMMPTPPAPQRKLRMLARAARPSGTMSSARQSLPMPRASGTTFQMASAQVNSGPSSLFGSAQPQTTGFGSTASAFGATSAFGSQPQPRATGHNAPPPSASHGGGLFDASRQRLQMQQLAMQQQVMQQQAMQQQAMQQSQQPSGGLFGKVAAFQTPGEQLLSVSSKSSNATPALSRAAQAPQADSVFGAPKSPLHRSSSQSASPAPAEAEEAEASDDDMGFGLYDDPVPAVTPAFTPVSYGGASSFSSYGPVGGSSGGEMHQLIGMQTFSGAWMWGEKFVELLKIQGEAVDKSKFGGDADAMATAIAVAYLETRLAPKKDVWEMVVAKARAWLGKQLGNDGVRVDELVRIAGGYF